MEEELVHNQLNTALPPLPVADNNESHPESKLPQSEQNPSSNLKKPNAQEQAAGGEGGSSANGLETVGGRVDSLAQEALQNVMKSFNQRAERLEAFMADPSELDLLTQQVELARVLKIDANEIRGDTGPILTQKDGYRGKDSTLYDELFDFYQVPPALPLAPMAGVQAAKTPGGSSADAPRSFADKHGPLKKFAPPNRWQTRHFFLHGRNLRYYKDAAEFRKLSRHVTRAAPGATVAVSEKGCYDLGQAVCTSRSTEITLTFHNGLVKRLQASTAAAATEWASDCQERCRYFSRQDKLRVLRQMALIQSLNIVLKAKDLEAAAKRESEAEAAALREKVKQLEATLWEAHNEDSAELLKVHSQKMDQLRDVERTMLSDRLSSLAALLGDSDDKARSMAELERRKAEDEVEAALAVMLRSKLLREAYRDLAKEVRERCTKAYQRSRDAYSATAAALAAKAQEHRSRLAHEHREEVERLRDQCSEETIAASEQEENSALQDGRGPFEAGGSQDAKARSLEYRSELLAGLAAGVKRAENQNRDLRKHIAARQQRIRHIHTAIDAETRRHEAAIVAAHQEYLSKVDADDADEAARRLAHSSFTDIEGGDQAPVETFWTAYVGSGREHFLSTPRKSFGFDKLDDVDDLHGFSEPHRHTGNELRRRQRQSNSIQRDSIDYTDTTRRKLLVAELVARKRQIATIFAAARDHNRSFHAGLRSQLDRHSQKLAAAALHQAVVVQSGLDALVERTGAILTALDKGIETMDTTVSHAALHRLARFIGEGGASRDRKTQVVFWAPDKASHKAALRSTGALVTKDGQSDPTMNIWTAAGSLVVGVRALCQKLLVQVQELSLQTADTTAGAAAARLAERAVRTCAVHCSALTAAQSFVSVFGTSTALQFLAGLRNHDQKFHEDVARQHHQRALQAAARADSERVDNDGSEQKEAYSKGNVPHRSHHPQDHKKTGEPSFAHGLPGVLCLQLKDATGHSFHAGYLRRAEDGDIANPGDDAHSTRDCARTLLLQNEMHVSVHLVSGDSLPPTGTPSKSDSKSNGATRMQLAVTYFLRGSCVYALFLVPPHQTHATRWCGAANCQLQVRVLLRGQRVPGGCGNFPVSSTCQLPAPSPNAGGGATSPESGCRYFDLTSVGKSGAVASANHIIRRRGHPPCATCGATFYVDDDTRTVFWQHEAGVGSLPKNSVSEPRTMEERRQALYQQHDFGHQFLREVCGFAGVEISSSSTAGGNISSVVARLADEWTSGSSEHERPTAVGWMSRDLPHQWVQVSVLPNAVSGVDLLFRPSVVRLHLSGALASRGAPPALEIRGSVDGNSWMVVAEFPYIASPAQGGSSRGGAKVVSSHGTGGAAITVTLDVEKAITRASELRSQGDFCAGSRTGALVTVNGASSLALTTPTAQRMLFFKFLRIVQTAPHPSSGTWNFSCSQLRLWGELRPGDRAEK